MNEPPARGASIAVDLGAESCRVSLLRWQHGTPHVELVHRFANGPVERDGHLYWPWQHIEEGVQEGLLRCAAFAPEGIHSIAADGWAVDYLRLGSDDTDRGDPFCYRDPRTHAAAASLARRIPPQRLRDLTGIEPFAINTVHQLVADRLAGSDTSLTWLNLPEYLMHRWGAPPVAEFTNATHTGMIDLHTRSWSPEILQAAGLSSELQPILVAPGTLLGSVTGALAASPAFSKTVIIAPACHDTASAIAGIAASGSADWAYISSGTWSLVGMVLDRPCNEAGAQRDGFSNFGGVGGTVCFHRNVNGLWILKQCLDTWESEGSRWTLDDLVDAAAVVPAPVGLLSLDDPELLAVGNMPARIGKQRSAAGLRPIDLSPAGAPAIASLLFHSLAASYAEVIRQMELHTGRNCRAIHVVGGGSRNRLLLRLTAEATGLPVLPGHAESATLGNFAVQLARLDRIGTPHIPLSAADVAAWTGRLNAAGS